MARAWFRVDWEHCLGGGGEGEVYLGREMRTARLCAVKVSVALDRAVARQQLAAELSHCCRAAGAGVVGLLAWNLHADRPFLVFELASAGTLGDEMRRVRESGQTYHPQRALERIREVLVAVGHLHRRRMVHGDIKPANLLRFGDAIKLTDFGASRVLDAAAGEPTDVVLGTRAYAAPEQRRGVDADERTDLYSVGCVLHEMLTGELPPSSAEAAPLSVQWPNVLVLPELDALVASLLDVRSARRPASAADALARVDAALEAYAKARRLWERLQLGASPY